MAFFEISQYREIMNFKCKKCNIIKDLSLFHKDKYYKNGHRSSCIECRNIYDSIYRSNNREKIRKWSKETYYRNPESSKKRREIFKKNNPNYNKDWYFINKDHIRVENAIYYKNNKNTINKKTSKWAKDNVSKVRNKSNRRRCLKIKATPQWLFDFDKDYISHIYQQSNWIQELEGVKYNVDHIIPLKNELVCGLNVPWNLQILTKKDNSKKHNKFDGTYENESWRL